jgi:hypothetical protein
MKAQVCGIGVETKERVANPLPGHWARYKDMSEGEIAVFRNPQGGWVKTTYHLMKIVRDEDCEMIL